MIALEPMRNFDGFHSALLPYSYQLMPYLFMHVAIFEMMSSQKRSDQTVFPSLIAITLSRGIGIECVKFQLGIEVK